MNEEIQTYENHAQDSRVKEIEVSDTRSMKDGTGGNNLPLVVFSKASHAKNRDGDGERYEESAVAVRTANTHANGHGVAEEATHTLDRASGQAVAVGFSHVASGKMLDCKPEANAVSLKCSHGGEGAVAVDCFNQTTTGDVAKTMSSVASDYHHVPCDISPSHIVRRLTPTECERLQGFPDGWTRIPYRGKPADECPDSPRYKALGNSFATNCCEYVLRRIVAALQLDMIPEAAE